MNLQPLIDAVKTHALANYATGGWDIVVECWSDEELFETLAGEGVQTADEAISEIGKLVGLQNELANDCRAAGDAPTLGERLMPGCTCGHTPESNRCTCD